MKFLLYNVLEGCVEPNRFASLIKFMKKEKPDVAVLLELNGWHLNDFARLKEFKELAGFKHHSFLKTNTKFNIGVFSQDPILFEEKILENFFHGLIKIKLRDITILATHLNPHNYSKSLEEVKKLISYINKEEKTIITGDFNSLSEKDKYKESEILELMKRKRTMKFGEYKIEYSSINVIEENDFHDAYLLKNKTFRHSVPTLVNKDDAHFTKLRLDYFFVNSILKEKIQKIQIIQNSMTNYISDHYPIVLTLSDD